MRHRESGANVSLAHLVERCPDSTEATRSNRVRNTPIGAAEENMSEVKQVIVVRKDLNMRKGKLAAQVAHAAMKFLTDNNESERGDEMIIHLSQDEATWLSGSFTKIVVSVDSEDALRDLIMRAKLSDIDVYPIIDAGKTEFNGVPTLTCAAFGPCRSDELNKITGGLPLI